MIEFNDLILNDIHTIILDFDGVFTDNKVFLDKSGNEFVKCDRSDGLAFDLLKKFIKVEELDIDLFILSTEKNPVVMARAKKLKLKCFHGIKSKLEFIKNYFKDSNKPLKEISKGIIYLGNDLNDFQSMQFCNYAVAPSDAHEKIRNISSHVMQSNGGDGFIREFVEKLIKARNVDILDLL